MYLVLVKANPSNPAWRGVMYSGSLEDGKPAGYATVWSGGSNTVLSHHGLYYVQVLRELAAEDELKYRDEDPELT
jgi:hypothetical protein